MFQIKPLGILFLSVFLFWFYKTKFGFEILPPVELRVKFSAFIDRIKRMRETKPTVCCLVTSTCLGSMAILGHLLSGSSVILICLIIAVALPIKYNFKISKLKETNFHSAARAEQEHEMDEFLPEINETNMCVLQRASDQSSISVATEDIDEERSEEIPSDLLIPDCIPEIDENSTDEDEALGIGVGTLSAIELKRSHNFKKESSVATSSSSDEDNLSEGLAFPEYFNVSQNSQTQSMIIPNGLLESLVLGLVSHNKQ